MSSVSVVEQLEEAVSPVKDPVHNKAVELPMTTLKRRLSDDESDEVVAKKIRTSVDEQVSVSETTTDDAEEEVERRDVDGQLVVAVDDGEKATDEDAKESEQEQATVDVLLDKDAGGDHDEGKDDDEKEDESAIVDIET
uniref:Glutamic acid-rich protein n=1 Tax=Angiostrongylus cantonensis TaxID=6313 RepID=C7BVV0_ANGCA|nr:hypothetical protein [Angiostrongylus cantonensis]